MSPNDIREAEDLNPTDDGDRYYISANLKPADSPDETYSDGFGVEQVKLAMMPVFAAAAGRVCRKESLAVATACKKHAGKLSAFTEWASKWFDQEAESVSGELMPAAESMAKILRLNADSIVSGIVTGFALRHSESAKTAAFTAFSGNTAGWCETWSTSKPATIAEEITNEIGVLA